MAHLTRPAEISGVSAGLFPETAAGNRAYKPTCNVLFIIWRLNIEYILAKTNNKSVRRFGNILGPLSRETKLNMQSQEKLRVQSH